MITNAKYLLRFDDLCPTMNWEMWGKIEALLTELEISPILAVVPDNKDPDLVVVKPKEDFWLHVRNWKRKGWSIGLHGYQHKLESRNGGILNISSVGEFAGFSYDDQLSKLRAGLSIFSLNEIEPDVWVAPAHSYDNQTLRALSDVGLKVISDGFMTRPTQTPDGFTYIPQQLWDFRWMPFGTWTVCYHFNKWADSRFDRFKGDLLRFKDHIISLDEAILLARPHETNDFVDLVFQRSYKIFRAARKAARGFR